MEYFQSFRKKTAGPKILEEYPDVPLLGRMPSHHQSADPWKLVQPNRLTSALGCVNRFAFPIKDKQVE